MGEPVFTLTTEELEIAAHGIERFVATRDHWPKEDIAEYRAVARKINAEVKRRREERGSSVTGDGAQEAGGMKKMRYWNDDDFVYYTTTATTDTSATICNWIVNTSCTCDYAPERRLWVKCPEHWSEQDEFAFIALVNKETSTGWTVRALVRGEVILHPGEEVRTMDEFIPLLRDRANSADKARIKTFFDEHPTEPATHKESGE